MTGISLDSRHCHSSFSQHEEGMGLIEDNEINNNTLAGVWITTGNKL